MKDGVDKGGEGERGRNDMERERGCGGSNVRDEEKMGEKEG